MPGSQPFCGRGFEKQNARPVAVFLGLFLLLLFLACPSASQATSFESGLEQFEKQRRQVAQMMEEGTLWVLVANKNGNLSVGSGFVIADGYAMTNGHVVDGGVQIYVGNSRMPMVPATVAAVDYPKLNRKEIIGSRDFALLRFSPPRNVKLPVLSFSLELARTDRISAWGYPYMVTKFDESVKTLHSSKGPQGIVPPPIVYTEGTVNSIVKRKLACIMHSAAIAGGNSGGPLVNWRGQVVGMNTWGYTESDEGAFLNVSLTSLDIIAFLTTHGITPTVVQGDWEKTLSDRNSMASTVASSGQGGSLLDLIQGDKKPADGGVAVVADDNAVNDQNRDNRLKDPNARTMFNRAIKGDVEAQGRVGASYMHGQYGFPVDMERAWHWLTLAAKQGDTLGKGFLGMLYLIDPEARDPQLGLDLLGESCNAENAVPDLQGFLSFSLYYFKTYGIPIDYETSFEWAEVAAANGSMLGKAMLAMHYYDGTVVDEDYEAAYNLALESANAGVPVGKTVLALLYYGIEGYDADLSDIIALATEAAENGEAVAQGMLAKIYAFGDDDVRDYVASERWARRASDMADPVGQYVLGWLYLNGHVVDQNDAMAWAYLSLAADEVTMSYDRDNPLLGQLEKRMSPADKRRGQEIRQTWLNEWGLED